MASSSWIYVVAMIASTLGPACTPGGGTDDAETSGSSGDETGTGSTEGSATSAGPGSTSVADSSDGSADTQGSSDDGLPCALPPVDDAIVEQLFIYGAGTGFVAVGSATSLSLAWIEFGFPTQVEACVEWSVDPVEGVEIDAAGVISVDPGVPAGTIVSVTADVEDGRRLISAELEVYVPLETPILGYWGEVEQLPCGGGAPFVPEPLIPELIFYDTGEFTVTWTPFESYIDYWGTFTHDEGTGALSLTVSGGNYIPADVDGEGTATVVGDQLRLEDLWLGTAMDPVTMPACGHIFE